jgi:hypothetical protein
MIKKNKETEAFLEGMLQSFKMEITKDQIISQMSMFGKTQKDVGNYKVLSQKDKVVEIETTKKNGKTEKGKIEVIDKNHIKLLSKKPNDPSFIFQRQKSKK